MRMRIRKKRSWYIIQQSGWEKGRKEFVYSFELETDVNGWGYSSLAFTALIHSKWFHAPADWIIIVVVVALDIFICELFALKLSTRCVLFAYNIWKRTGQQQTRGSPRPCWQSITISQLDCIVNGANLLLFLNMLRDRELIIMFLLMLYSVLYRFMPHISLNYMCTSFYFKFFMWWWSITLIWLSNIYISTCVERAQL